MDDTTKVFLTLFLSPLLGAAAALVTTRYKLRQEHRIAREKEAEHVRLKVLNPLLVACEDLLERSRDVARRRAEPAKRDEMRRWFAEVGKRRAAGRPAFAYWANDEGYFAVSTLYITALYFCHAGTIRRDFPFFELSGGRESALLSRLSQVRMSIGGKFGIWEAIQDCVGAQLLAEGRARNYREFCELVADADEGVWFSRLVDFYRDVDLKLDDQYANIEHSLGETADFLRRNLGVPAFGYRLTPVSVDALRRSGLPAEALAGLSRLAAEEPRYLAEVAFVDAVVARIGQDLADDYKPSILRFADRRLA